MGIIDPCHVMTMPKNVAVFSGFDVLWYEANEQHSDLYILAMLWNPILLFLSQKGRPLITPLIALHIKVVIQYLIFGLRKL